MTSQERSPDGVGDGEPSRAVEGTALEVLDGLAHKLRTHLGTIVNYAYLLSSGSAERLSEADRLSLDRVAAAARSAGELLESTSHYLDAAVCGLRAGPVDLVRWVRKALDAEDEEGGIELRRSDLPATLPAIADPGALEACAAVLRALCRALAVDARASVPVDVEGGSEASEAWLRIRMAGETRAGDALRWTTSFQTVARGEECADLGVHQAVLRTLIARQGGCVHARIVDGAPTWELRLPAATS